MSALTYSTHGRNIPVPVELDDYDTAAAQLSAAVDRGRFVDNSELTEPLWIELRECADRLSEVCAEQSAELAELRARTEHLAAIVRAVQAEIKKADQS